MYRLWKCLVWAEQCQIHKSATISKPPAWNCVGYRHAAETVLTSWNMDKRPLRAPCDILQLQLEVCLVCTNFQVFVNVKAKSTWMPEKCFPAEDCPVTTSFALFIWPVIVFKVVTEDRAHSCAGGCVQASLHCKCVDFFSNYNQNKILNKSNKRSQQTYLWNILKMIMMNLFYLEVLH